MGVTSVVTGVYNGMPFLREAVKSVLGQTLKDLEYIVVDDGSTDASGEYLDSLTDSRLRVVHQENQGCAGSRNVGIAMSEGEFVAIMDADDISLPHRLERQVAFLQGHPQVGVVGTQVAYIGPWGGTALPVPVPLAHEDVVRQLLQGAMGLAHPSACFRAQAIRSAGGFRDVPSEDTDLFLRILENFRIANLEETLLLYRLHPGSVTAKRTKHYQLGKLYSICCFRRRRAGTVEPTYEGFIAAVQAWPLWKKAAWEIDRYALREYRKGVLDMLRGRALRGRARLLWAALCSPGRTLRRLRREFARRVRAER